MARRTARVRQPSVTGPDWPAIQDSPDFDRLRKALRGFVFPVTAAFLLWYLTYVVCAAYARGFMNVKVFGNVTLGLLFGLLQFVSTFTIAALYARHADRKVDPLADDLRADIEGSIR